MRTYPSPKFRVSSSCGSRDSKGLVAQVIKFTSLSERLIRLISIVKCSCGIKCALGMLDWPVAGQPLDLRPGTER